MQHGNVILRFSNVTFEYSDNKRTLEEASFSVREDAKITIMGQNGAGKSTIFKLILGQLKAKKGEIHVQQGATIGIAEQTMAKEHLEKTVKEYFSGAFVDVPGNIDKRIADALEVVNFKVPLDRLIKDLSGGQQARLLLAYALIQNPDILLLDEPTNNLDSDGIGHLTTFLIMYPKTVIVISHDAYFLNSFTDGVLNLDVQTKKVEQYVGNYLDVVEEIAAQIERDQRKNAQLQKEILDKKEKVNFFAHKGGKMRKLASKLREEVEENEENMVDVRREDRTIREFTIPSQEFSDAIVKISSLSIMENHQPVRKNANVELRRRKKLLITGPNGIGKTTLLQRLASNTEEGASIAPEIKVGYYRQDFSGLDYERTAFQALEDMMDVPDNQTIYATGGAFLLSSETLKNKVGSLSEGQKGLLCFARFVLQKPGLLILDEPTNHINFRHLPVIAEALEAYEGAMILVSHSQEFVDQINISETLDLSQLR